ncbi:hypothetical protein ABZT49_17710 [Methylobacterium sp. EM32]|uniref:hypothetical protein n=1 Tax=Methylobacterium sp. EM32 TaxID=3163481 RepID=UPI0033AC5B42
MGDVFELAEANGPRIRAEYATIVQQLAPDTSAEDLSSRVRTSAQIAINMRPHVAAAFFRTNYYGNIYEVAHRTSKLSGRDPDRELRRVLGKFYDKRIAFDRAMNLSTNIVYAALNMGGLGCYTYGHICVVLSGRAINKPGIAYLRADSLLNYVDDTGKVNEDRISCDVCLSDAVAHLVCIKHVSDPKFADSLSWPEMICNDKIYIEAFLLSRPVVEEVCEIRIAKHKYDEFMDLALCSSYRSPNGDAERALSQDFIDVILAAKERGVRIVVIEAMS